MNILTSKKSKVIVATTAIFALGGGAAFAYWTSTGSGSGNGSTGTSVNFTIVGGAVTGPTLAPGGPSQQVAFTVNNPGAGSQNLSSVTATVANADGSAWVTIPGCSAADYAVSAPVIAYGQIAPGGSVVGSVTVTMNNLDSNQNACQGVAYPLYFVAA